MQLEPCHKSMEKQLLEESKPGMLSSLLNSIKRGEQQHLTLVELNPLIVTAYDSISDPVLVVSLSSSSIVFSNKAADSLFQYSLKGQTLDGSIPGLSRLLKNPHYGLKEERMDGFKKDRSAVPLLVSVGRLAKEGIISKNQSGVEKDILVLTLNKIPVKNTTVTSRYKQEFEEVKVVGRGGFGIVLEAKNRLDGQNYAIKKVRLNCSPENLTLFTNSSTPSAPSSKRHSRHLSASDHRLLNEVKTFALLSNHPNVIRYYNAWIESAEDYDQNLADSDTESEESVELDRLHQSTLYIQMQLCPYQDLRLWIRSRECVNIDASMNIFYQITLGLAHIHSQGVIHRDVKPENIFVDQENIFLGDFGLAKQIEDSALSPSPRTSFLKPLVNSTDDGTFIYMAPENRLSQMSTTKSDIFSLGIILFELLTNFDTDMERAVMLNKLRSSGNIPQFLTDQFPAQSNMLSELIAPDPKDRPTAEEILSSGIIFKDSRRVTISSFGDSASPSSGTDFPGKLGMYPRLRETISALSLDTPNSEEFLNARHRRMTEEWGPFHFVQGEDDHFSKFSSSYNPQNARAFYHGTKANGVSASYKQINDLTDADPKLRILELERDVAYLEAKLKAMTDYYKNIESELERSPVESLPISSENLSTPIPIPFQK